MSQTGRVPHYPRGVPLHLRSQRTRGVPHNPGKVGPLCLSREQQSFPTSPRESPISGEDTQGDTAEGCPSTGKWGSPRREHGAASTGPRGTSGGAGNAPCLMAGGNTGGPSGSQGRCRDAGGGFGAQPGPAVPAGAALARLQPDAIGRLDVLLRHRLGRHCLGPPPRGLLQLQPRRHGSRRHPGAAAAQARSLPGSLTRSRPGSDSAQPLPPPSGPVTPRARRYDGARC